MFQPGWLELPLARTIFHGPKPVRAIEVLLYLFHFSDVYKIKKAMGSVQSESGEKNSTCPLVITSEI